MMQSTSHALNAMPPAPAAARPACPVTHRAEGNMLARLLRRLLGIHPHNTVFNYNWVIVRPLVQVLKELAPQMHGRIADLGAGASPYYDLFRPHIDDFIAIDYPAALPRHNGRGLRRAGASAEAVPLADASLDGILCSQVLSQVRRPDRVMSEVARLLKPGGRAIVSVPHASPLHSEPYDLCRFTPGGLAALAADAGLRVESIRVQGRLFSAFALALAMNLVLTAPQPERSAQLVPSRQLVFAPLIAAVNVAARGLDVLLPFERMPANFVLVAVKP